MDVTYLWLKRIHAVAFALVAVGALFFAGCAPFNGTASTAASIAAAQQHGVAHFGQGDYAAAAADWKQAAMLAAAESRRAERADALMNLGSAYQMLGQYDLAKASLDEAVEVAEQLHDHWRAIVALNDLGAACTLKPEFGPPEIAPEPAAPHGAGPSTAPAAAPAPPDAAAPAGKVHVHGGSASHRNHHPEFLLTTALHLAQHEPREPRIQRIEATLHDNLGNFYADARQFDRAAAEYRTCVEIAEAAGEPVLAARALANASASGVAAARFYDAQAAQAEMASRKRIRDTAPVLRQRAALCRTLAEKDDGVALSHASDLPASAVKTFVLNQIGQTDQQLALSSSDATALENRAREAYTRSALVSEFSADPLSYSYATGYLGRIEEIRRHYPAALDLTRKARSAAQRAQSSDALYLWQWQLGRVLGAMGDRDAAIESYQQAVETVKAIRNDIAIGHGNQRNRFSFREDVGRMYFELADLLLRKSSATAGAGAEDILAMARSTLESLKSAELEDFLHDDCVQLYKAHGQRQKLADTKVDGTAVVYVVALEDRIELLVQVRAHLYERTSGHTRKELDATVTEFRKLLPYIATSEYRASGANLYKWLIEPLEPLLKEKGIDTLVFVPDGLLRTIPMSALFDARTNTHLIEHYAVAVVPGLEMVETSAVETSGAAADTPRSALLVSGLSQPRGDFPSLPFVPAELINVQQNFHAASSDELLNSRFILENLRSDMRGKHYTVVHIASHGHFGADASKTFILTFDDKNPITLDELEKLIRPQQYDPTGRPQPLDLLVLSCCQTAAGDDRAALGLAGVAVKSGARSALATLWSVNDQASTILVSDFYRELAGTSGSLGQKPLSKAKALQEAQKKMLRSDCLAQRHPCVWAPYLIIGNWQ